MKYGFLLLNILFTAFASIAQTATEDFVLSLPANKVANSLYNTIRVVDVRPDQSHFGIVQLGAFNRKARVVPQTPLNVQLTQVLNALTDNTAKHGELFLLLRQFSFAEVTGAMSEKGYCQLRAVLFARAGEGFQKLDAVDTVIVVRGMDVTKGLFRQGSKAITDLIAANLNKEPLGEATYTSTEVVNFDRVEKQSLALYQATAYKNGVYRTFASFANQTPEENEFTVEWTKDHKPSAVKITNEKGKPQKVAAKDLYAFVYEGQPYIATDFGYYPLTKKEEDFYFTGRAKVAANNGDVMLASAFFGVIGGLLASVPGNAVFEMKIDHVSGGFIRMKEVQP